MELTVFDIFGFVTAFQFLLFFFFLLTLKKGNRLSNKLFSIFLLSKSLCLTNHLAFRFRGPLIAWFPHIFYIGESFEFLLGPTLYLYARSLAYRDFTLKKRHALHLIPFVIHVIMMSSKFHIYGAETKLRLLNSGLFSYFEYILNSSSIYLHFLIYTAATLYIISIYRSELKNLYSSIDKIKLSWLSLLVTGFILLWGIAFVFFILNIFRIPIFFPHKISPILLLIFANFIIYKGLKQPEIFAGIKKIKQNGKPLIAQSTYDQYLQQLKVTMEREKPYLIPAITLNDLADRISISPRYLSYVINKSFHHNFFDFINTYRIKESQRLLADPDSSTKTILEVLYEVGFNSKSTFNAAFKKHSGMTPTQFKKQNNHWKTDKIKVV